MDFAKRQLTKQGWTDGSGLGKTESGITEPVKVKIKNDTKGVGHDSGAEFTFHWWDHLFNKAASSIQVKHTENGVEIANSATTERSKTKKQKHKNMLYGQFVKGATLSGGKVTEEENKEPEPETEVMKHALMPDNEEEIFRKCGGRTAHKGARHGLKLNGKLQRIESQEQLLLDKYARKSANKIQGQRSDPETGQSEEFIFKHSQNQSQSNNVFSNDDKVIHEGTKSIKKKKKKRKQKDCEKEEGLMLEMTNSDTLEQEINIDDSDPVQIKKKKKKRKHDKADTDSKQQCDSLPLGEEETEPLVKIGKIHPVEAEDCSANGEKHFSDQNVAQRVKEKKSKKKNKTLFE